ncbi:Serine/threonine-protein kinase svkA [Echinococcus granulosus]|uniref:Serine/threonine-protein kinase svkA n=1 Tax=Echinococcus granulosus TaxID=6210 RepID=W6USD9_ECHGR|nr:Serine/threonine-protein kinase svkA [Echinococcus granulosus]EUB56354.1 Serine/threonine-protein kinase svkA [Echinococcus granulosus]
MTFESYEHFKGGSNDLDHGHSQARAIQSVGPSMTPDRKTSVKPTGEVNQQPPVKEQIQRSHLDANFTSFAFGGANRDFARRVTRCPMPKEVIDTEKSEGYDTRADVWSLGVTGLELWEAEPPLAGVPPMKAFSLITHGPHPLSLYPSRLPPESEEAKDDLLQPCSDLMPPEMFDLLSNRHCGNESPLPPKIERTLIDARSIACSDWLSRMAAAKASLVYVLLGAFWSHSSTSLMRPKGKSCEDLFTTSGGLLDQMLSFDGVPWCTLPANSYFSIFFQFSGGHEDFTADIRLPHFWMTAKQATNYTLLEVGLKAQWQVLMPVQMRCRNCRISFGPVKQQQQQLTPEANKNAAFVVSVAVP